MDKKAIEAAARAWCDTTTTKFDDLGPRGRKRCLEDLEIAIAAYEVARGRAGQEPAMYQVRPRSFTVGEGWREVSKRQFDDRGEHAGYPETDWERRVLYTAPPAPAAVPVDGLRDAERLDWLMRKVSGKELREIGVDTYENCTRADIDAAMLATHPQQAKPEVK